MMKSKKIMALLIASVFALALPLSACVPDDPVTPTPGGEDEYTVTLDYNDEVSRPRLVYVEKGKSMEEPATPLREGYELSEWTGEKEGGTPVTFPYTPTADTTIYAQWEAANFTVTFDYNFTGAPKVERSAAYGATVEAPADDEAPEYPGYFFLEWMTAPDAANGTVVSFPYTVERDVTLYARWLPEGTDIYQVTFDANYPQAEAIPPVRVIEGETLGLDKVPRISRVGFALVGWSTTQQSQTADVVFPYTPTESVRLYAVWEEVTYTVSFYYNYTGNPGGRTGRIGDPLTVPGGTAVTEDMIETPTRVQDGYEFEFDGWWNSEVGGTQAELPYTPTGTTTTIRLYAHWKAKAVTPADNKFDAEFTPIDPTLVGPGYSGNVLGTGIIQSDLPNAYSAPYPLLGGNADQSAHMPHYVTYLFAKDITLTFNIRSDKDVSGVTLYLALSTEFRQTMTFSPTGSYGYAIKVNGTELNYAPITVNGGPNFGGDLYKGTVFTEYRVSVTIDLKAGDNVIELVTNNNTVLGGTYQAIAPVVDYIRLDAAGAVLTWQPEYDNLYRKA